MPRPRLIEDEQLLRVAREAFLEQGFSVTTATIAARAGVSEGTLFKRFHSKEDLFIAAIGLSGYGSWRNMLVSSVGEGEVRGNLESAALSILRESDAWARNMLAVFSRGIDPTHNPMLSSLADSAQKDMESLVTYLRRETERGRVRPHDVEVTAMTVLGALSAYIHRCTLPPETAQPGSPVEAGHFVSSLVDLLWPGLKP